MPQHKDNGGVSVQGIPGVQACINPGEEDQMEIQGYSLDKLRMILIYIACVLTVGIPLVIFYWKPEWKIYCTHRRASLQDADTVILKDQYKELTVESVKIMTKDGTNFKILKPFASFLPGGIRKNIDNSKVQFNSLKDESAVRYFVNRKLKYIWDSHTQTYDKLRGFESNYKCSFFHASTGLSVKEQISRQQLYGANNIVVHVTPVIKILFLQALNPFYVFQLFSVILWYIDEYVYYASCIIVISVISLTVTIYETRKMQRALKSTLTGCTTVSVCRDNNEYMEQMSDMLVPGDIIEVPRQGCIMQCDAVLLSGNCIVNESMLTGESVPVTKTPLPNHKQQEFNMKEHSRHVLFCGTHVLQTRYYGSHKVRALVIRTGFSTAKGELVRSIMFPKPVDFKFKQDSLKFIGVLAIIASVGMIYTLVIMIKRGDEAKMVFVRTLDLVTIVIPPALPAAMTVGIVFAQSRLKKSKIYCINTSTINLCGAINVFCFDKTGTLTEDGLDMYGVVETQGNRLGEMVEDMGELKRGPFLTGMAACHSLTILENRLTGDPLDLKMFEATGWELEEPGEDTSRFDIIVPTVVRPQKPDIVSSSENFGQDAEMIPFEVGILRQFTFSSRLQRMSVIARTLGSAQFDLYAKGAPEMIASLCKPDTVPDDFHEVLMLYTQRGYRVIALAWKPLYKMSFVKVQRAQRETMEKDLMFLGLLLMENRLKSQTLPIIRQLRDANIRTIMVTGDNMLTALSVARDCQMIEKRDSVILVHVVPPTGQRKAYIEWTYAEDTNRTHIDTEDDPSSFVVELDNSDFIHLAITGKCWDLIRVHFPDVLPKLAVRGTVFARMSPEQKAQLIETLQLYGYYVGMCGDGANDCGALKTAHAGISLSEAEASVASPFTSKDPNISCVPTTIREGRAALVTSFGVFKYMACYSLTQFTSVCILYWIGANLTDFGFLWIDLILLTTLSITFGYTKAYEQLARKPPGVSLLSVLPILSIITQMVINIVVQIIVWEITKQQPWFEAYVPNEEERYKSHEVTVILLVSNFQYITLAVVLSKSTPYRKTIFSNYAFLINLVLVTAASIYITIYPFPWLRDLLELDMPPSIPYLILLVAIALINFLVCFMLESFVIDSNYLSEKIIQPISNKLTKSKFAYVEIEEELNCNEEWPPKISKSMSNLADLMKLENPGSPEAPEMESHEDLQEEDDSPPSTPGIVSPNLDSKWPLLNHAAHTYSNLSSNGMSHPSDIHSYNNVASKKTQSPSQAPALKYPGTTSSDQEALIYSYSERALIHQDSETPLIFGDSEEDQNSIGSILHETTTL